MEKRPLQNAPFTNFCVRAGIFVHCISKMFGLWYGYIGEWEGMVFQALEFVRFFLKEGVT